MHLAKNMPLKKTGPVQYRLFTNEVNADYAPMCAPRRIFGQYPESMDKNVSILVKILYYSLIASLAVPLLARY